MTPSRRASAFGETRVVKDLVCHSHGRNGWAWPRGDWQFSLSSIRLIGEWTTPAGPIGDCFYVFVADDPPRVFEFPMESLERRGECDFWSELEARITGRIAHRFANSVEYASSVMWPESLAGRELFDFEPAPRAGLLGKLLDRLGPRQRPLIARSLESALGIRADYPAPTSR